MRHQLLKDNIRKNVEISDIQLSEICQYFKFKHIKKGEYVLKQGSVYKMEGFVLNGCFRIFTIDKKGNEKILYFAVKDWWLMDIDSFMNQIPSDLNIQALEDSEVLLITKSHKENIYSQYPIVEKLFRKMSQKAIVAWQRRLIRNQSLTASERYHYFLNTYPSISSKITDRQISSYLGVTHEFLSKIKNKMNKVKE